MSTNSRPWGVPADVSGPGVTYRHERYLAPLETPFPGGDTVPALFEVSAKKFPTSHFLGTRRLLKQEFEKEESTGREFEKVSLGEYEWETFERVFERASNFSSGLINLGHDLDSRVAIFAETRAEWNIGLQVDFIIFPSVLLVW